MKIDHFDLTLEKEGYGEYYMAGEELKGVIEVHVVEKVRIARLSVRIIGSCQTAWRNKLMETVYESKELILDEYKDLTSELALHCSEALEILEGQHKITFRIKLPLDVVSSIEKENHGLVKYTCMAVLDVPEGGDSEIVAECDFGVVSLLNLDAPHFCLPTSSREQVNIIGFCCHRPKGYISADVKVSELGLLPGETVRVCLTVENTVKKAKAKKHTGMHQCALLSLCQQLDFRAANRQDPKQWDHKSLTTAVHSCGTCKANQVKGPETKYIDFVIPNGLPPTSARAGGLVVCSYFFRLDMAHFDVIVPVIIGSQKTLIDTGGPQAIKE
ncbi:arrestin domain-containing protein 17 [Ditylenchus destructor]|uniref:Arrestin domain-containing protein 17 n=1 Tax=Ditylenchus destructor TaxID=166010 RepID=A0AAD4MNK5_9BILA|nr:arrestin domain-containing protein 17 [Ditylenchus destructor]